VSLVEALIYLCSQSDTMRKHFLLWSLLVSALFSQAQNPQIFAGFAVSDFSGRTLQHVRLSIPQDSIDVMTNEHGYFSIEVTSFSFTIFVEKQGYENLELYVRPTSDGNSFIVTQKKEGRKGKINTKTITPDSEDLYSIALSPIFNLEYTHYTPASLSDQIIYDVESDKIIMDRAELESIPFIFSEADVSKALQIHPGIDFANDGFSDMTVRGGGLGQNQVLLDGVPVYNIGHFNGYVSNFNSAMTEEVTMYKAAFPARYGGRLASVMDVKSSAGNSKEATVNLAVSPALGNINVGLPIDDKGSSLGIGFRRSYIDLLFSGLDGQELVFRDFNTKLHLKLNPKNSLTLSFFSLKDKIAINGVEYNDTNDLLVELDYSISLVLKNQTTSANLFHIYNKRLTGSFTGYYTNYSNGISLHEKDYTAPIGSNAISDYSVRFSAGEVGANGDFEYRKDKKMLLRFGLQNRLHLNNSGSLIDKRYTIDSTLLSDDQYGDTTIQTGIETSFYVENEYKYSNKLSFNVGLRATLYSYHKLTNIYPEPRISGRYLLSNKASIKFSYARMHQFMHLYNTDGTATDNFIVYLPSNEKLLPEASNIFTVGYNTKPNSKMRFVSEAYVKTLANQPIFYAADLFDRADMVANSLVGTGTVIGIENSFKYVAENSMFWVSATFSKATRKYEELNRGEAFSFDYDRRLVGKMGFVINYENFVFSITAVGATGNPYTLPTSKYRDIEGGVVLAYDEINNYRATHHARVDTKFEWHFADEIQSLELSIYNLMGTRNVSSIFSRRDDTTTTYKYTAYTTPSYAFLPFITYRIKI
jgi:hypothetical protein